MITLCAYFFRAVLFDDVFVLISSFFFYIFENKLNQTKIQKLLPEDRETEKNTMRLLYDMVGMAVQACGQPVANR